MKRMHLHVNVTDIKASSTFYTTLFGEKPTIVKDDYAKWMLDDPRVNFVISTHHGGSGIDHVGIQSETEAEFTELSKRLKAAELSTFDEAGTQCCYAVSDKTWVADPSDIRWETFITHGEATTYGSHADREAVIEGVTGETACCS